MGEGLQESKSLAGQRSSQTFVFKIQVTYRSRNDSMRKLFGHMEEKQLHERKTDAHRKWGGMEHL